MMPETSDSRGTLQSIIAGLKNFGDRKAVGLRHEFGVRWWSYARLWSEAHESAALLRDSGVEPGDRILLWGSNSPEWVAFLFACVLRGAIVVPLDEGSSPDYVQRIAEEVSPRLVVCGPEQHPDFLSIPKLPLYRPEPSAGGATGAHPLPDGRGSVSVSEPRPSGSGHWHTQTVTASCLAPEATAIVIFTSGTTSKPRGVTLTHGNLMTHVRRFRGWRLLLRVIPFRLLTIAPLSHVQGLMLGACIPLSVGLTVLYVQSPNATHVLRVIRDNRITLLSTVPRVLQVMTRAIEQRPFGRAGMTLGGKLATVHAGFIRRHILFTRLNGAVGYRFWVILVGGAALDRADEQFWRDTGRFLLHGYGLTETAALASFNGPFSRRVGSIGKASDRRGLRIGEDGEVLVCGPHVSPGYYGGASEDVPGDGFLHTGDLVRRDAKGYLYFVGRKKQMLVTSEGFNVYPEEVESVLNQQGGVVDSVIVGRQREGCEEVHAVLLLEHRADPVRIVQAANERLESHQKIRSWSVWPEPDFPRTSLLKVRRDDVARRLAVKGAGASTLGPLPSLAAIAAVQDSRQRLELLARYLSETPKELVARDRTSLVAELGLSSLDAVELVTLLERRMNVSLDSLSIPVSATLGDLHEAVTAARSGPSVLPSRQPAWSATPVAGLLRAFTAPACLGAWSAFCQHVTPIWHTSPAHLQPPFLIAAAPHKHWVDAFAVCAALPYRLRRKVLVVTNRDFGEYFDPAPEDSLAERWKVGAAYYAGLPLLFPFTILPHFGSTREGLLETARMIDRGYVPLTFPKGIHFGRVDLARHDPGIALMALQCGVPVLPVVLENNEPRPLRPRLRPPLLKVHFAPPVTPAPGMTAGRVIELLEQRLRAVPT